MNRSAGHPDLKAKSLRSDSWIVLEANALTSKGGALGDVTVDEGNLFF